MGGVKFVSDVDGGASTHGAATDRVTSDCRRCAYSGSVRPAFAGRGRSDELSFRELIRAFARMLPRAGDVLACGTPAKYLLALHQEGIFVVHCLAPGGVTRQDQEVNHSVIERQLDGSQLPFPSQLFAGLWMHFPAGVSEHLLESVLRLLMPRGLLLVTTTDELDSAAHLVSTSARHLIDSITLLGTTCLAEPQDCAAMLFVRDTARSTEPTDPNCAFCPPARFAANKQAGLPGAASVVWGDDDFLLMPDIAPIALGHLLLLPTRHYLSMGALPDFLSNGIEERAAEVSRLMELSFSRPALFIEHGATRSHEAGSCIDHAHWHCLPDTEAVLDNIERMNVPSITGPLVMARDLYSRGEPYFLVRRRDECWFFSGNNLPCQFMRLVAADGTEQAGLRWQHAVNSASSRLRFHETLRLSLMAADTIFGGRASADSAPPAQA